VSDSSHGTTTLVRAEVREGTYGAKVATVEPGGAEFIPLSERHGRPLGQFWTWVSPNMEFATVFVGFIGVWFFGLSFWMATLAIVLGSALGSVSMGTLAARGPLFGVPQMVLSRLGFGYVGNVLPAGLNAVVAGIGWFAVNSVSGAFALSALLGWSTKVTLLIIVLVQVAVAFFGHNMVHAFERWSFPFLVIVFLIASVVIVAKAHPGAPSSNSLGGFLITLGAAFGYAAGWNPYAADYTRYLPPDTDRRAVGWWSGFGVFASCVLLEVVGAAAATATSLNKFGGNPTAGFTSHLATPLADATLLAIALGAVCANALNVYSGAMSFLALGVKLPLSLRRAIVALVFGVAGFFLALSGLHDAGQKYTDFLLIIAYWIGPWLGVFFADQFLRRGKRVDGLLFDRKHNPWSGFAAMLIATVVSIWLFANQNNPSFAYVGPIPKHHPGFGDLTFEVGFVLAALLYALFFRVQGEARVEEALEIPEEAARKAA